jgi:hypothetical protein
MMRNTSITICLCVFGSLVGSPSYSVELVSLNDEFGITSSFSRIVLSELDAQKARVFVDIDRLVVRDASASENAQIRRIAIDRLAQKLKLVPKKEDSDYIVQIRMEQYVNYAIRNPHNKPSRGLVMASICKYPIREIGSDCQNIEYDYFYNASRTELFDRFFAMWIENLIPGSEQAIH